MLFRSAMGAMAGFFYVAYVCAQMPLGMLIDRFGVRLLLCLCVFLAGASTYVFASTDSMQVASWMRFLLGIASAAAFVSALKLATAWFPPTRLALAVGMTQTLGMFGGMLGTALMPVIMATYDWRHAFTAFSLFFVLLAVVIALCVRNSPHQAEAHQAMPDKQEQASMAD